MSEHEVDIFGDDPERVVSVTEIPINYCPICGRRLSSDE